MIDFYIPNKKGGEKIILLLRRHWIILFIRILFWILLLFVPPMFALLFMTVDGFQPTAIMFPFIIVLTGIYYLYIPLFIFNTFIDYYLDVWLVTNERIVNIEQRQLFSRIAAEHKLSQIQDVASEMQGILSTLLNFGDVHIQTAGEKQRFEFKQVPNPQAVKRKIASLCEYKKRYEKVKEELDSEIKK